MYKCRLCKREKDDTPALSLTAEHGVKIDICSECIEQIHRFNEMKQKSKRNSASTISKINKNEILTEYKLLSDKIQVDGNGSGIPKPSEISAFLDKYVIGQKSAKIVMAVAVYNHLKRVRNKDKNIQKSNILMVGPSGSGKTELAKTIALFLNAPIVICDATRFTEAGYVGDNVESALAKLYMKANKNIDMAEKGIVFIDEVDKLKRHSSSGRDVSGEGVQQALLKLIEGSEVEVPISRMPNGEYKCVTMNTENILFICSGAFNGLQDEVRKKKNSIGIRATEPPKEGEMIKKINAENLISFGLIPELVGRLPVVVELEKLTKAELIEVMHRPKNSMIEQYKTLLELDGAKLEFKPDALEYIAELALASKTGARSLKSILENTMIPFMYSVPDMKENQGVVVTKDKVEESTQNTIENMVMQKNG